MKGPPLPCVPLAVRSCSDRLRTTVNVFGDCVGCGIIDRYAPRFLPPVDGQTADGSSGEGQVGEETALFKEEEEEGLPLEGSGDDDRLTRQAEQPVDEQTNSTLL